MVGWPPLSFNCPCLQTFTEIVFKKALNEPFFARLYATLCQHLLNLVGADNELGFYTLLIGLCAAEFARIAEGEHAEVDVTGLSAADAEIARATVKRRLIGALGLWWWCLSVC